MIILIVNKRSKNDEYDGVSKSPVEAIKRSCYINDTYITEHYIAKYNNAVVGTMTIVYNKNVTIN